MATRRRFARTGFTLVELLVVICVIGLLAALLLPAVNAAREAGRKTTCVNNQRQLGLAMFQYESAKKEYPGYCIPQALFDSGSKKIASRPISWVFALLPRLERRDIADNFGAKAQPGYATDIFSAAGTTGPYAAPDQMLKILVCPSDAQSQADDPEGIANKSSLSYVVNCGLKDIETNTIETSPANFVNAQSHTFAHLPRDWQPNGIFHYQFPYEWHSASKTYVPTGEKTTKVTAASIKDGLATTLLLSENADSGNWTNCFEAEVGFYWQATVNAAGTAMPRASAFRTTENLLTALYRINEKAGLSTGTTAAGPVDLSYGRPSSYHRGGVVITYADAHTSFLNEEIDYLVYCLLMTPNGKYSLPAGELGFDRGKQKMFLNVSDGRKIFAKSAVPKDAL